MNQAQSFCRSIKRSCNSGGDLPSLYRKVEYLQSTGTQYLDTGVNASTTLVTSIDFSVISGFSYSNTAFIFGAYYPNTGYIPYTAYCAALASSSAIRVPNINLFSNVTIPTISADVKYNLSYQFGSIKFNGTQKGTYSGTASTPLSVYLFGRHDYSTNDYRTAGLRIHYVFMGSNDDKYREFIPCVRKSDNKPGLYDIVTKTFFTNDGSGEFTVGDPNGSSVFNEQFVNTQSGGKAPFQNCADLIIICLWNAPPTRSASDWTWVAPPTRSVPDWTWVAPKAFFRRHNLILLPARLRAVFSET